VADVNANIGVNIDASNALAQLKSLQRQLSQFHTSVAKSSAAAASAQSSLQKNLVNSINATGAFTAELRTVRTTSEAFTNSLEKNKFSMREYFRYAGAATRTFGKTFRSEFDTIGKVAEDRVKKLQTQYIKLGRDSQGVMKAIAVIPNQLDMSNASTQLQLAAQKQAIFNQLLKQGSTNLLNFGKNTQWAGRQLMVGFTLPLASLGMVASKSFMDMEQAALKFRKVYGDLLTPKEETQQALENIQELAREFTKYGIAVSQTVSLAAEAAAAGFQGLDLQRQTTEATRLSILGQIDSQQALDTTIALQNAFKMSSEDLADSINFLNAVENQTVVSLDDITVAIPKVAPVIQQLGGNVKDLAFFMTAMKQGGINASEGANALKSGLASLINPTNTASKMLAGMGINIKNIVESNQGDLKSTVIDFALALDKLDPLNRARAIEQMFGKFQFARLSALFSNVIADGTQASRVLDLAGASIEDLSALSESELGMTAESAMNKFRKAVEDLKFALVPVGEAFLQSVTPILEFFGNILEKFADLSDNTKKIITVLTIAIGGIGPVALMAFGLLANGIANIIKLFATLRNGYLRLTGQSVVLGEQTQYLTTEQLEASAAAHSLNQSHANLTQTFTAESGAVRSLIAAYTDATLAASKFAMANPGMMLPGRKIIPKKLAKGSTYVPGRGNKDTVPSMLTPGEAVIPKDVAQDPRFQPIIDAMVNGNLQGFNKGSTGVSARKSKALKRYVDLKYGASLGVDTLAMSAYKDNKAGYEQLLDRITYDEESKRYIFNDKNGNPKSHFNEKQLKQQIAYSFKEAPNAFGEMSNRPISPSVLDRYLGRVGKAGTGAPAAVRRVRKGLNKQFIDRETTLLDKELRAAGLDDQEIKSFMGKKEESHIIKPKNAATKWDSGFTISDHAGVNNYLNRAGNVSVGRMVNDPRLLLSREQGGLGLTPKQVEELKKDYAFAQSQKHPTNSREFSRIARLAALEVSMNDSGLTKVNKIFQAKGIVALSKIRTPSYYKDIAKQIIKLGDRPRALMQPSESLAVEKNEKLITKEGKEKKVTGQTGEAKPAGKNITDSPRDTRIIPKSSVKRVIPVGRMRLRGAEDGYDDGSLSKEDEKQRIGPKTPDGARMLPIVSKPSQSDLRKTAIRDRVKDIGSKVGGGKGMGISSGAMIAAQFLPGKAGQIAGQASGALFAVQALTMLPGPLKLVAAGAIAVAGGMKLINSIQEKNRQKVEAFGDAIKNTTDQTNFLAERFGFTAKGNALSRFKDTVAVAAPQRAELESLKNDPEFKKAFKTSISGISKLSDADAITALQFKSAELLSQGMSAESVQQIMIAIQEEAGKATLNIDFKGIKLDEEGLTQLASQISVISKETGDKISKSFEKFDGIFEDRGFTGAESNAVTEQAVMAKYEVAVKKAAAAVASFSNTLSNLAESGQITGDQLQKSISVMFSSLGKNVKSSAAQMLIFKTALTSINKDLGDAVSGITKLSNAEAILAAATAGVSTEMIKSAIATMTYSAALEDAARRRRELGIAETYTDAKEAGIARVKAREAEVKLNELTDLQLKANKIVNETPGGGDIIGGAAGSTEGLSKATKAYLKILDKEISALEKKRDANKAANNEMQRQIDLQLEQQRLTNQMKIAQISGNFLGAALIGQQQRKTSLEFSQETRAIEEQKVIDRMKEREAALRDGANMTPAERAKLNKNKVSAKIPKFHNWNGPVPGTYGQELPAVLRSGTEGVYQEGYINNLKQAASSTTNSGSTVYNIDMTVNGAGSDPKQVAELVMKKMEVVMNKNNKSNAGLR
jgi:TP901 family phage tail tape measure protein